MGRSEEVHWGSEWGRVNGVMRCSGEEMRWSGRGEEGKWGGGEEVHWGSEWGRVNGVMRCSGEEMRWSGSGALSLSFDLVCRYRCLKCTNTDLCQVKRSHNVLN